MDWGNLFSSKHDDVGEERNTTPSQIFLVEVHDMIKKLFRYFIISVALWHIYMAATGVFEPYLFRVTHYSLFFIIYYLDSLIYPKESQSVLIKAINFFFFIGGVALFIFFQLDFERIISRTSWTSPMSTADYVFGTFTVFATLEAARRKIGSVIVLVCCVFIAYAFLGNHLSGLLWHRGLSFKNFIDTAFLGFEGIFGAPIHISSRYIVLFVIFGSMLNISGAGNFLNQFSNAIVGHMRGGAAKIAVVASACFGMISGSATANVVTTGSFTIPLMKKLGYKPSFAAGVEAVASAGGSLTPPLMGSTAFLIAEIIGIPYIVLAQKAAIPAVLYYISLLTMVHLQTLKMNLPGIPRNKLPKIRGTLRDSPLFVIPFVVLIGLLILGYSPNWAGFWGIVFVVVANLITKGKGRMSLVEIMDALENGVKNAMCVILACAAAGIIIGMLNITGLSGKFTSLLLSLSGGFLFPTLIITMLVCILLGMGMPIISAYVILSALAGPAIIQFGVPIVAAHLFILYFAVVSVITPPVALAAYAAAGLAETDPVKTGFVAFKLGIAGFIIPFIFVYQPALLLYGNLWNSIISFLTAIIGVIFLAVGIQGWLIRRTTLIESSLFIIGSLCSIIPGIVLDIIGLGLIGVGFVMHNKRK